MRDTKIIVINGMAQSGKDTFMDICSKHAFVQKYSTIDYYKDIAKKYFGWDGEKDEKGRKLLSDLKVASFAYNNYPLQMFDDFYKKIIEEDKIDILFCCCRDISEIEKLKNKYESKLLTLLVVNDRVPIITSNEGDANVFNYSYDYIIENNGTIEELEETVMCFLENI